MKKAELDQMKSVVTNTIHEAIQPIRDELIQHRQTLYGVSGDNGVCGDIKKLKEVAEDYKVKKGQLVLVAAAIGGAVSWVAKIIPNPFTK